MVPPLPFTLCRHLSNRRDEVVDAVGARVGGHFAALARAANTLGLGPPAPATSLRMEGDALVWYRAEVDGREVVFGTGGDGPPVLFLHGWALGSRAYKRALRRLTARGCRVYAPALPGFGGSDPMPPVAMSIEAYGDWADRFLDAVGVTEPVIVIGHSLGGGIGIQFAHRHPGRVRYLVLLNAVGGARWDGRAGRSLSDRPLWDWAREFGRDFLPLSTGLETLGAMSQDVIANVLRNPFVLLRAGELARTADLTGELLDLSGSDIPVLALTSASDNVIPATAFDALCASVGAEGRVVPGGHSWLLAAPDSFAEVVDNIVEVEVSEHRAHTARGVAELVRSLLRETTVPGGLADALVDDAPPLWLTSESPSTLATDLALCHPPLGPDEVRAVAHLLPDGALRLTVVARDRAGLLADTCGVLAHRGLTVTDASAMTWPSLGLAMHSMVVDPGRPLDDADFEDLGARLQTMWGHSDPPGFEPVGTASVEVSGTPAQRATITVTAPDQVGLLWAISRWFSDAGVQIEAIHATTRSGTARDSFIVVGDCRPAELAGALSRSAAGRVVA